MSVKRALIVDDSRSARVILSRMLETYGLQVDTAESAEQALEFLRKARPDVVFMDHLMPGMDGFDAVRAMKASDRTASIPVMMYTSQEGEHYEQEARRVGAIGVLSKTLRPTDVSRTLYELNLLPDRREYRAGLADGVERLEEAFARAPIGGSPTQANTHKPANLDTQNAPRDATEITPTSNELRAVVTSLVDEQHDELHKLMQSSLDAMSNRLSAELRAAAQQASMSSSAVADDAIESNGGRGWFAVALILVALVPTAVIATLYWRTLNDNQAQLEQSTSRMAMVMTDQQTQIEQLRAELRKRQDATGEIPVASPNTEGVGVPYGELALSGARVQQLQAMIERLQGEGFRGRLRAASYVGDFCLSGSASNGYKVARDDVIVRRCDLIGNPFEDGLTAVQRQSPEFVALLASVNGKLQIDVQFEGRKPAVVYPPQTDKLTAGEWNRVAARNNRVEFAAVASE